MAQRHVYMIQDPKTGLYSDGVATRREIAFVPFEKGTIFETKQKITMHLNKRIEYRDLYEGCVIVEFVLAEP